MNKDMFSGTTKKTGKFAACKELVSVSKVYSFSKLMHNKQAPKGIKLVFAGDTDLKMKTNQKKDYDNLARKIPLFSLPNQIRIRATDREGNTIEITY